MWRDLFCTEMAECEGTLLFKVRIGETVAFTVPIPDGRCIAAAKETCTLDETTEEQETGTVSALEIGNLFSVPCFHQALRCLDIYCETKGIDPVFCMVPKEAMPSLTAYYTAAGREYGVLAERDWYDYIYIKEDLIGFKGKRFNGQRNHVNKFRRLYPEAVFRRLNRENIDRVKDFCLDYNHRFGKDTDTAREDEEKTLEVLDNFELYDQIGGYMEYQGKVIGVSIGEVMGDTLVVHIEKADIDYEGIYPALVQEFSAMFAAPASIRFINREDDAGDEGLRRSKLSYHPVALLEKYTVSVY